jgi:hypothetical protein
LSFGGRIELNFTGPSNAAPEWQAKTQVLKQETGGGLSTQGACYTAHYKTPIA